MSASIEIVAIAGMPEIEPGADLGALIVAAAHAAALELGDGDIVCVSQKAVSKAEDRFRVLAEVEPGARAQGIAAELDRDPRLVELVLAESRRIVRATAAALIVERNDGWICANAGIDASNVGRDGAVLLLPADADASARRIRTELERACGARPGVLVSDSFGRPWRLGQADVAIGCAGVSVVDDWRGRADTDGRELTATVTALADQLAAAADLARDKASREPAVLVRGASRWRTADDGPGARALQRDPGSDLFR